MSDSILPSATDMTNVPHPVAVSNGKQHQSLAGYWFSEQDAVWQLDKNVKVNVGKVRDLLSMEAHDGFITTLAQYARTLSSGHTSNMTNRLFALLRDTGASSIDSTMLINYRASLTNQTQYFLGALRGFLYKWHALGYPGVSDEVMDLLQGWTLKGNVKGDAVQRLDPTEGPLTDNELMAFNASRYTQLSTPASRM